MTIILFLIDTSASMNQRSYLGTTLLDIAKASVENFMKIRSRDPNSRWDRYMLLTFEDPPANIKAGWKESHVTFITELKSLQANGLTAAGPALKHAFDLLNLNRMQSGIDTYGQGRCPFYLEPAVIICITDGGKLTTPNGIHSELNLPMNISIVPGSELTKEPFRWDQRIFGIVLKIPGSVPIDLNSSSYIPSAENHPIDAMCEVTGGRSYAVYSQKLLNSTVESIVGKLQSGVVIHFEKIGPDPPPVTDENQDPKIPDVIEVTEEDKKSQLPLQPNNTAWHSCRRLILVPRSAQKGYSVGHWPIPEAFWPDVNNPTLTPRTAHPIVRFSCAYCEPLVIDNLPFDKYELEPSPLTQYILERRLPNMCWQVFINNSAKYSELGHPFGYLKASSTLSCVNLFVMPYNYPVLLPLLDELFKVHKLKPNNQWRQRFENYLKTMPGYFAQPLKRALGRMGAHNLVPDNLDNCLSYSIVTYLKKLKNTAKMEMDRLIASVGQKINLSEGIRVSSRTKTSVLQRKDFKQLLQNVDGNMSTLKQELTDFNTFTVAVPDKDIRPQPFRNPYDITRKNLLDQIARMRTNFLQTAFNATKLHDEDQIHSVPIQQMGNYQEYLKKQPNPLRELENTPTRVHMFGNPFKVNKNIMVDEAEDSMLGQQQQARGSAKRHQFDSPPSSPGPRKRKPGPLPRDIPIRRPVTPPVPVETSSSVSSTALTDEETVSYSDAEDSLSVVSEPSTESSEVDSMDNEEDKFSNFNHIDEIQDSSENGPDRPNGRVSPDSNLDDENIPCNSDTNFHAKHSSKKDVINWSLNYKLRNAVFKELKKPGRNYEKLFSLLNTVQGDHDTKRAFIRDTIQEAARFKKKTLIKLLEQYENSVQQSASSKGHRNMNCANLSIQNR
ncbi:hypothetical protein CHS0354_035043 [Potamilus streckersoni]|uniref:VWFA domain-containing protein n=1 Tax=Potamilus streckersoni TaxID=2493646 RepID=A0AAE0VV00_9BIVA|nr:hypothetical protein CHS0354_035043 [Potamilus streckersoni]